MQRLSLDALKLNVPVRCRDGWRNICSATAAKLEQRASEQSPPPPRGNPRARQLQERNALKSVKCGIADLGPGWPSSCPYQRSASAPIVAGPPRGPKANIYLNDVGSRTLCGILKQVQAALFTHKCPNQDGKRCVAPEYSSMKRDAWQRAAITKFR